MGKPLISALVIYLIVFLPLLVSATAEEDNDRVYSATANTNTNTSTTVLLKYKIIAIFSTLIVGIFGVCLPIYVPNLDERIFTYVKPKAACVIYLTGVFHNLPNAKEILTTRDDPMAGVVAMVAAIITMIESFNRFHQEAKHKLLITRVMELGIVHSVMIGMSLGASQSVSIVKPLIGAITWTQLFEGFGLGRYISKSKFELNKSLVMVIVFSLTTPLGIGIGIGIADFYNENSSTTMIVSGLLNNAATGVLYTMALLIYHDYEAHIYSSLKMLLPCVLVFIFLMRLF